ncbi:MAG: hypothetical protein K2P26_11740 [Oscillospiraceae bacterium]|nr:hypothetical protein [Oscillospiraceae bacterium]
MKWKLYILLIAGLFALTSCGSKPEEPKIEVAEIRYGVEFFDAGIVCDSFADGCAAGTDGQIYLAVSEMDEEYLPHDYLYRVSEDGLPDCILAADDFLVNGAEGFVQIKNLQTGADGSVWLNIYCLTSQYSGDYLWHVDQGGTELDRFKLNQPADGTLVDDNKWTYVVSGTTVSVLNQGQQFQFKLEAGGNTPPKPVRLSNGQAGFLVTRDDVSAEVRTVDTAAQDWGETYRLPKECVAVYPGSGEYLFFSTANQVLGGWNAERNSLVELVSWLETGVNTSALLGFSINADGQILAAANEASSAQLAMLTPGTDIPEKTVLTLAAISSNSYLREQVAQFNRTSTSCRIVLEQYYTQTGEWFSPDEFQQGMTRLLTELSAGKLPDLLYVEHLPVLRFGAMGMLEDLWPYIENDPDLGREAVMDRVLECAEQDGKLYTVFNSFGINTVVGSTAVVGDRTSWTLDDLRTALDTMPEGCAIFSPYSTKLRTLKNLVYSDLGSYVDWESGACSFDSEEFKEVLSFCNEMEAEQGGWAQWYTLIPEGREMLLDDVVGNFIRIQEHEAIFGGEISYVGYPRSDGACGSSFIVDNPIAMTAVCKDKEGAWEFLRQFLLPQELPRDTFGDVWVSNADFPVNRESFEALLEESMKLNSSTDEEDRPPKGMSVGGADELVFDLIYTPTTQAQYDQIMELYHAIDTIYTEDSALWEIVSEQVQPYFAGDKSVDETAKLVQSRAELYVNELK